MSWRRRRRVSAVRLTETNGEANLSVADTGCGIPAEDRPQIFERFYRVNKARTRSAGGTGLGLAICKSIVDAHGGTIGFDGQETGGTVFWVRLPRGPAKKVVTDETGNSEEVQ